MQQVELAVIGGSGLYEMEALEAVEEISVNTPFGEPSAPILIGRIAGKPIAFLARHGRGHRISPSEINFRANIYALKSMGVKQIVSVSACGSLRAEYEPRHIVIPDQLFDRTQGRDLSFFGEGLVVHIGLAEPFCERLSNLLYDAASRTQATVHKGGAFVVIEGPRFSTKAESNTFRQWGMDIIGMTAVPEAQLAREAEICYATMAHVTDYDVWHETEEAVTVEAVIRNLLANTGAAKQAIRFLAEDMPQQIECDCHHALQDAIITHRESIPASAKAKLGLLVGKYLD